ncbi:TPA: hemagglutinin, partial [Neisseria meningitidis]
GGIITSGKSAEDKGKNLFQTATLTASDIQNHSRYEGKSFGIGGSFDLNGGWDGTVTDKQGRPTDRISLAAGYGSDSDSQSSITKSGINTRNIHITDEAGQLARTGRTAKETEARIYTGIDTETADQHTGRLKNSFDKDAVAKEINLQREVTKEFGRNAAQAVAAVADKLGNTQSYERYQEARTLLEAELQNTDSEAEKAAFRASLGQVNAYLAENQSRYDTWKEGGIGRSILHGAAGGLTTGSLGGILAGGGTSLAAPYLDKAAENLGPAGKAAVNALGGAAIGYATGGSGGAVVGANVDWNNRQLHPKEMALADKYAEALKREVEKREGRKISSQEAAMRIRRQILRWVDKGSQDGYTDQSVISLIGMKGEDKALGYTWDYRDYGARNPQTYNDPKLFEEYRRQDKPEYRNLTWLHSGTKDTKIRQGERKNEEFALNVAEGLTSLVNPNPRIKVPILAGIRNLKNIKPTVTGSDPLLAGAGNIRIPATSNVAKVDRIPDTALASKSHQKNDFGTSKGQGAESSIPVPQAISIKIKNPDKTVSETTYQSNPKHTPGQLGFKFDAGIEPKNSVQLIESSVQIGKQRFAIDDKGHIHRYMGGDRKNEPWHWAGSTSDKKNPLSLTSQQKAGIKRAYPEQSKNKLLK